jgi:hypothetical protein
MASSSITSAIRIVPCAACGQTINTSMTHCRFCNAPLDALAAAAAADEFAEVNQAISDASYVKIMAGVELTFFCFRFVPFIVGMAGLAFLLLMFALPIFTLRWWLRFGKLPSKDPEFLAARRNASLYGGGGSIFFVLLWFATTILPRMLIR